MTPHQLPNLDDFSTKFCAALRESGCEKTFATKWGLHDINEIHEILEHNIQGGYTSHHKAIMATPPSHSALTIGPGMGFCVFLLSEIYPAVFVAEPDSQNASLIQEMSPYYRTKTNQAASDKVKVFNAGISLSSDALKYWEAKRKIRETRRAKGNILNFVIDKTTALKEELHDQVSRLYLHKVLSSLSISDSFENILGEVLEFLDRDGVLTWSEPKYIFSEVLQINAGQTLEETVRNIFDHHGLHVTFEDYEISSKIGNDNHIETWTMLIGRRS